MSYLHLFKHIHIYYLVQEMNNMYGAMDNKYSIAIYIYIYIYSLQKPLITYIIFISLDNSSLFI